MPSPENLAFAERLKSSLKRLPKPVLTASGLAHGYNLRAKTEPISPQAARKWISGESRPGREKIEVLAAWLGVSSHWLQYGPPPAAAKKAAQTRKLGPLGQLSEAEIRLVGRLRVLSEYQVNLLTELVDQFATEREVSGAGLPS